jgi:hypothetical protein
VNKARAAPGLHGIPQKTSKRTIAMTDNQSLTEQQYIPAGDGWGDAAAEASERTIRGQLLKFADWRWTVGKEGTVVKEGTRLVALATVAMWVRWENGKPVEQLVRRPGERLIERNKLSHTNEDEWPIGPGDEPQDPWQNTRLIYFVDPDTAEAFTFSTSSYGGRGAVIELGDTIERMRHAHPDAAPIVELRAVEMPTKHGKKSKPFFKIVGWKNAIGGGAKTATPVRQAPAKMIIESGPPPIESYDGPEAHEDINF